MSTSAANEPSVLPKNKETRTK